MEVNLTKVIRQTTDKKGDALKTKDGRNYTRLLLKTTEYGDKFISGFDNAATKAWKEGDKVEVEVEQKGEYLNFKVPKPEDKSNEQLTWLLRDMMTVKILLQDIHATVVPKQKAKIQGTDVDYPENNFEEEPF